MTLDYSAELGCVTWAVTGGYPETLPCAECLPWGVEISGVEPGDPAGVYGWAIEWHAVDCPVLAEDRAFIRDQHAEHGCWGNDESLCPSCQPDHPGARRPARHQPKRKGVRGQGD